MAEVISISRLSLHDQVAARLRTMLIEGQIPPGAKLNERELCERLHVSRTPLREAIKLLGAEGLVDLLPNRGAVAVKLTEADVTDTFELLAVLEGTSGELAAQRITDDEIAEVRALHYEMLAFRDQRRCAQSVTGEHLSLDQRARAVAALSHQPEREKMEARRQGTRGDDRCAGRA